jgi:hypothetical protein
MLPASWWVAYELDRQLTWYMFVAKPIERTGEVTAYTGLMTGLFSTVLLAMFKIYSDNGRNWDSGPLKGEPCLPLSELKIGSTPG